MKKRIPIVFRVFGIFALALIMLANSSNPNNGNTGAPGEGTCAGCHSSPPPSLDGEISLSGLPATVMPNTTYTLTLTSSVTAGSANTSGFQMVSLNTNNQNAGDMQDISADVGTNTAGSGREYVEHRGDKAIAANMVSWTFEWTSPAAAPGNGDITMYASSLLANNNGSSSGDRTILNTFNTNLTSGGPPVAVSITSSTDVSCFGGIDGSATATATGGTPPINYLWSNGQTNPTAINLAAGFYSVTASDAVGQTATANVVIGQPPFYSVQIASQTNVSCFGESTGQAIASASGGTSPYTYEWSNGATGPFVNNLAAGMYTVTATDANDCETTTSVNITQPTPLIVSLISQTNVDCFGNNTGAITANPTGGTPPYSFNWSNGGTGPGIQNLIAGTYILTVTDGNSCTAQLSVTITQPPLLTLSLVSAQDPDCNGAATGSATVEGNGGTSPYTYEWSNGGTGSSQGNLPAGSYTVTITDDNDCETSLNITLTDPPGMQLSGVVTDVSCGGACDGAIDLSVSGGNTPYTYSWSNGMNIEDITNLCVGDYTVTVTDASSCTAVQSFMVGGLATLDLAVTNQTNVDCNGNATGAISVEATGGTSPYNYSWSTGDTGASIENLEAGTYGVTVTDANMCTDFLMVTITEPVVLLANASATAETSAGANDGTASASPSGGTTPYNYSWSTGDDTAMIEDLQPGTYTVTVTDGNNCSSIESVTVNPFACVLGATIETSDASCANATDGSATVSVTDASDPVTFAWSSGGDMATETGLAAGSYSVTVGDATACTVILNFQINDPALLTLSLNGLADADCPGASSGQVEVIPAGGTPDYSILWQDGSTDFFRTDLSAGTYMPEVTDANGCTQTISITISEPAPIAANFTSTDESAYESADGTATAGPTGGTSPYSYVWSTGATGDMISDLEPGVYSLTITDAANCQLVDSIEIFAFPCSLSADVSGLSPACNGAADGTATATAIDGDAPFTFEWSNGMNTQNICELPGGTYVVTITDANGCPAVDSIILEEPELLVIELVNMMEPTCNGDTDGQIEVAASGGTPPVSFAWTDEQNNTFSGPLQDMLAAGTYEITATDANGCVAELILNLEQPDLLEVSITTTDETSNNANDGTATANPVGGTGPYTYAWSNGGDTQTIENLPPGTYSATITDANGCMAEDVSSINPFGCSLSVNLSAQQISCNGAADGSISAAISDENDPPGVESIDWSNGAEGVTSINNLPPGNYSVTVVNLSGCSVVESVVISQPPVLSALLEDTNDAFCFGADDGSVILSANGGTPPYTYMLEGQEVVFGMGQNAGFAGLVAGDYTAELTDANGCVSAVDFSIGQPSNLSLAAGQITGVDCPGDMTGMAELLASGGTPPYDFFWPGGLMGPVQSDLTEGIYDVLVMDANGCEGTITIEIPVLDMEPPTMAVQEVDLFLDESGIATLNPEDVDAGTDDNCGIASLSLDINTFDCSMLDQSPITVELTALDISGNSAQATTLINVLDTISPELDLPADIILLNCDGFYEYEVSATDNCGIDELVLIEGLPSGSNFPIGTTTVSWQATDSPAGNTTTGSFTVTVENPVVALDPIVTPTCPGEANGSAQALVSGGQPPYAFQWSDNMSQTTETATDLEPGTYEVLITDSNGCEAMATAEVTAYPEIEVSVTDVVNETNGAGNGAISISIDAGDGPFDLEWYMDGDLFSDQEMLVDLSAGTYELIVTDVHGCSYLSDPILIENITGTMDPKLDQNIRVYPNPADQVLEVRIEGEVLRDLTFVLYDATGRKYRVAERQLAEDRFVLPVDNLANGLYLLQIVQEDRFTTRRIIIQH
ncbi:MAG: T9SS type A sorting domain-containing protein [Bacteroidetes bacterium]|nr:T9SS type A sorting domain-containing protein [Bacteroidota bacterium]